MALAMYHRCELEIVEAECLPSSSRGGKPDAFVVVTYPEHGNMKHKTKVIANSDAPLFGQRFVLEAKQRTSRVTIAVFDRHDDAEGLLGHADLLIGTPGREVGCRWVPLTPARGEAVADIAQVQPKVRVVWQCSTVMLAVDEASGPAGDGESATVTASRAAEAGRIPEPELTSSTVIDEKGHATTTAGSRRTEHAIDGTIVDRAGNSNSGAVSAVQAQIITRLTAVEDTLRVLLDDVRTRMGRLEDRVGAVESYISGHGAAAAGGARTESYWTRKPEKFEDTNLAASGDVSTHVIVAGEQHNAVIKSATGTSALDAIRAAPTRIAAEDEKLVANYTFAPVRLPKPLGAELAGMPLHDPHAADRRLNVETKAVGVSYNRMVAPL
jgi:hypothetical protein